WRGDVPLEPGELLGDRGGAVAQCDGDCGEGAALFEFAQQPKAAQVQCDHAKMLTGQLHLSSLDLMGASADDRWRGSSSVFVVGGVLRGDADFRKVRLRGGCVA